MLLPFSLLYAHIVAMIGQLPYTYFLLRNPYRLTHTVEINHVLVMIALKRFLSSLYYKLLILGFRRKKQEFFF